MGEQQFPPQAAGGAPGVKQGQHERANEKPGQEPLCAAQKGQSETEEVQASQLGGARQAVPGVHYHSYSKDKEKNQWPANPPMGRQNPTHGKQSPAFITQPNL